MAIGNPKVCHGMTFEEYRAAALRLYRSVGKPPPSDFVLEAIKFQISRSQQSEFADALAAVRRKKT